MGLHVWYKKWDGVRIMSSTVHVQYSTVLYVLLSFFLPLSRAAKRYYTTYPGQCQILQATTVRYDTRMCLCWQAVLSHNTARICVIYQTLSRLQRVEQLVPDLG